MMRAPFQIMALLSALLVAAACGPEAPPRAGQAEGRRSSTPLIAQPEEAPVVEQAPNPRTLGDPNAPIVVVEYSDFQ